MPSDDRSVPTDPDLISGRRRFLMLIGTTGLLGAAGPVLALAQGSATVPRAKSAKPAAPAKTEEAPISQDARILSKVIQRRYGKHLDAEQLESVTRDLDGDVQAGQRLRAFKLENAAEPDFTFRA
jgi:hypothetical protein